jgi:hypothetical protein
MLPAKEVPMPKRVHTVGARIRAPFQPPVAQE